MPGEPLQEAAVPAGSKPFSVQNLDIPADMDVRAISNAAEAAGENVVTLPVAQTPTAQQTPAPNAPAPVTQPIPTAPQAPQLPADLTPQAAALAKFLRPDGTVDVEKLQTSSKQLDEALQNKVLSIEEMVGQYLEKEKDFRNLPKNPDQVARAAQQIVAPPNPMVPPPFPTTPPAATDPNAIHAQLMQDYQRDPLGTIVDLVKAINSTENKEVHDYISTVREQQHVEAKKQNLAELAKSDPRVAHPVLYQEILAEMGRDPGYFKLRNPYKAAWNEVKERLRLGDTSTPQPSKPASPILGGGSPPPVPSTTGAVTPGTMHAAIAAAKTKDEMSAVESELRRMATANPW